MGRFSGTPVEQAQGQSGGRFGGTPVDAAPSRAAQIAKGVMEAQQRAAGDVAEYQAMPGWQKPFQAAGDVMTVMGDTLTQGYGDKGKAWLKSHLPGGDDYGTELAESRRATEGARNRFGNPGTVAALELATNYKALPSMVGKAGNPLTRIGTSIAEGSALGAAHAGGHDEDMAQGAAAGAALGGLGGLVGEGVHGATQAWQLGKQMLSNPAFRAELWKAGKDAVYGAAWDAALGGGSGTVMNAVKHAKPLWEAGRGMQTDASGLPPTQMDMFNNAQRAAPSTGVMGAPGLRDVLTKAIARGGIWAM